MFYERVAGGFTEAVDEVEHALGQACILKNSGPQLRGCGRELGGFQHHGASRGDCGCELPRLEHERSVPGGDEPGDALGFAVDVVHLGAGHFEGVVVLGDDEVGEKPEVFGGAAGLALGLSDGEAGVPGFDFGEFLVAGFDGVGDGVEHARFCAVFHARPGAIGECFGGGGDGTVDVGFVTGCGGAVGLVGLRVEHLEGFARD